MTVVESINTKFGVVKLGAAEVEAIPESEAGQPNGVATLNGSGTLPEAQLPSSVVTDSTEPTAGDFAGKLVEAHVAKLTAIAGVAGNLVGLSNAAGVIQSTSPESVGGVINPTYAIYGAKGNGIWLTDGAMTSGSFVLGTAHIFTEADVGKPMQVNGAGPGSGLPLVTTIASVAAGVATLAAAAESTVSAQEVFFATDDTVAIQAALNQAHTMYLFTGAVQTVRLPNAAFLVSYAKGTVVNKVEIALKLPSGVIFEGSGLTWLGALASPRTIVTEAFTVPLAGGTIKVANAEVLGKSAEGMKGTIVSTENFQSGLTWTGSTATTLTGVTDASTTEYKVGSILADGAVTALISTSTTETTSNFKVRGFVLDGLATITGAPGQGPEVTQVAIHIATAHDFEVCDNEIRNFPGKAINVEGVSGTKETSNYFVRRNNVHNLIANAIRYTAPCQHFAITDNLIHDTNRMVGGAESIITSGSLEVQHGEISRNRIWNWGGRLDFTGSYMKCDGNIIQGSSFQSGSAIDLFVTSHSSVTNNIIDMSACPETLSHGISQEGEQTALTIGGNVITGAKGNKSLELTGTGTDIAVSGNWFGGVSGAAIKGIGTMSNVTISGNIFAGTATFALTVEKLNKGSITGNVAKEAAVALTGLTGVPISGNSFMSFEGKGSALRLSGPSLSVMGNRIVGANGTLGVIEMDAACLDCTVMGNIIETTAENAAWIAEAAGCDRNLIMGNHLLSTSTGSEILVKGPNTIVRWNHGTNGTNYQQRTAVATNVTMKATQELLAVTSTAAERVVTLPEASQVPMGVVYRVKDESGAAATHQIKLVPKTPASEKIDGAESLAINTNYGKAAFYSNQANWFTV
jgi:hypothetical protein